MLRLLVVIQIYAECSCLSVVLFISCYGDPRDLHSFPTRRSSDLGQTEVMRIVGKAGGATTVGVVGIGTTTPNYVGQNATRSEEHTSELQSQFHLVCRLLLEKKNTSQCCHKTRG